MKSDELKLLESTLETLKKDVDEIKVNYALKADIPDVSGFLDSKDAQNTYAKKSEIPDTSSFLIANDLGQIYKAIEGLQNKNNELYSNLSIKVIKHTFKEPGQITLLSETEGCSGRIYICIESPSQGKQYMEYDFKCRLGPCSRNSDKLRKIKQIEHLNPTHKGFNVWCKIENDRVILHQYGIAENTFPHKVNVRIIGWANE